MVHPKCYSGGEYFQLTEKWVSSASPAHHNTRPESPDLVFKGFSSQALVRIICEGYQNKCLSCFVCRQTEKRMWGNKLRESTHNNGQYSSGQAPDWNPLCTHTCMSGLEWRMVRDDNRQRVKCLGRRRHRRIKTIWWAAHVWWRTATRMNKCAYK